MSEAPSFQNSAERALVLHFGAHKTASTHLQNALAQARDDLAAQGVTVYLPDELRKDGLKLQNHLAMPGGDSTREPVLKEAFGKPKGRVVISEENMLGQVPGFELSRAPFLYPRLAGRLALLTPLLPRDLPVVLGLCVREPASFIASCWSQRLMGGRVQSFEEVYGGLDPAQLVWTTVARRLLAGFADWPEVKLVAWAQEDWPKVSKPVMRALLGPHVRLPELSRNVAHPGLSAAAAEAILAERDHTSEVQRERMRHFRRIMPKGPDFPAFDPFDAETRARSAAAYKADMERLTALPKVEFLRPEA